MLVRILAAGWEFIEDCGRLHGDGFQGPVLLLSSSTGPALEIKRVKNVF